MIYSYRRVSTDEQHNGPQAQADDIKGWIDRQNQTDRLMAGWKDFFDNGVSGSVPLGKRPEGAKLLAAISPGDTVVVSKLDRLFRSVADAAATISQWNATQTTLVAIQEGFDMSSPMGRAMAQMASVFAELEREMIRSRTKAALAAKKSRGECVGEVPYGWYKDPVSGMLLTIPTEQKAIDYVTEMHSLGEDAATISKYLNAVGYTAKKGGRWSKTQVQRVIDRARKA